MKEITLGDRLLSAWKPFPCMIWIQTREPKLARKLAHRGDSKLIASNFKGPYLRIFAFEGKTMSWAERLIKRYQTYLKRTDEAKNTKECQSKLVTASNRPTSPPTPPENL